MYRYGFNGMETDSEVKEGAGQHYTTYFRQYDPRLGRWWSNDPVVQPGESPYAAMLNNPVGFSDPFGNDPPGDKDDNPLDPKPRSPIVTTGIPEQSRSDETSQLLTRQFYEDASAETIRSMMADAEREEVFVHNTRTKSVYMNEDGNWEAYFDFLSDTEGQNWLMSDGELYYGSTFHWLTYVYNAGVYHPDIHGHWTYKDGDVIQLYKVQRKAFCRV